eukprot:9471574-Pyramimonas_sp.AAC.1
MPGAMGGADASLQAAATGSSASTQGDGASKVTFSQYQAQMKALQEKKKAEERERLEKMRAVEDFKRVKAAGGGLPAPSSVPSDQPLLSTFTSVQLGKNPTATNGGPVSPNHKAPPHANNTTAAAASKLTYNAYKAASSGGAS